MARIGVRELRQNASQYLDLVKGGEAVEITERGQLVAVLVPPGSRRRSREELIAAGILIPAQAPFTFPKRVKPSRGSRSTDSVLQDLRREKLP